MSPPFGDVMRAVRKSKGRSLRSVAADLGVSVAFLCDVELGRRTLSPERLDQVAASLGIDVSELEMAGGLSAGLVAWLKRSPDVLRVLWEARRTGKRIAVTESP